MYWLSPVALSVTRVGRTRGPRSLPSCLAALRGHGAPWAAGECRAAGTAPRRGPREEALRCFRLPQREVVRVDGKDSASFLQGLTTGDMAPFMESGGGGDVEGGGGGDAGGGDGGCGGVYGHFLNVQGRVMYDALFYRIQVATQPDPSILIECDSSITQELQKHLKVYKIRRKVAVRDPDPPLHVWAILPPDGQLLLPPHLGVTLKVDGSRVVAACRDPRTEAMGWRLVLDSACTPAEWLPDCEIGELADYNKHRYRLGMAEGVKDLPPGVALPLESNLVYANGVSFSKGCYLGQELTARTHHTGVIRKRLMPVSLLHLPEGTRVVEGAAVTTADGKSVGKLRTHDGDVGLALVRLAHANERLHVSAEGGHALELKTSVPDWWHKDGGGDKNK
uniref:Transferase CAF17, mitochondrial n=1 Tax=Petromyzon marinus TaxID=7757 RepID=A0AAJ7U7J2_PETMA|nr:putative transferase CAF17, mitochondrial [Petromyzon marinus]XP_032831298.1 putative transferase CAF17, mitochondrial [Petromyzon marinus]